MYPSLCWSPLRLAGKPVWLQGGGLTTNRPSRLSPIGFHLPEGRLLQASRPVSQPRRAPPLPSPGFITGIPMAQAPASNLLSPRPGRAQQAPRAEHTLALQLSDSAVHDRDPPRPQAPPAPAAGSLAAPRGRQGPPLSPSALKPARAPCPLAAAWLGWHHAARACPPAHAPLAAPVGAAVPGRRPPHHRPQGKCVSRPRAHLRGGERGLLAAHLQEGEGR